MSEDGAGKGLKKARIDAGMLAALVSVAVTAVLLVIGAAFLAGGRMALGVAIGGVLAPLNLWVFAQVGEAFLARRGKTAPWVAIALVKLLGLLGLVWIILRSGVASGIALAIGYGALPIGITVGSLFGPRPSEDAGDLEISSSNEATERRSFGDAGDEDVLKASRLESAGPPPSER